MFLIAFKHCVSPSEVWIGTFVHFHCYLHWWHSLITKPLIWDVLHSSVPISGVRLFLQILWILLYIDVKIGTLADSETLVLPRLLFRGIISHCSNSTRWKIIVCWRPLHYSSCTTNIDLMVTPSVGTGHRILWLWHIKMWQPGSVSSVQCVHTMYDVWHLPRGQCEGWPNSGAAALQSAAPLQHAVWRHPS